MIYIFNKEHVRVTLTQIQLGISTYGSFDQTDQTITVTDSEFLLDVYVFPFVQNLFVGKRSESDSQKKFFSYITSSREFFKT